MSLSWILSVVFFSVASSGSPGPNNMLLATTGANHGFRRAVPHVLATGVGICLILVRFGLFGSQLLENGAFRGILKWGGMAYLAWLAYKIGTSRPKAASDDEAAKPLGFFQAVLF